MSEVGRPGWRDVFAVDVRSLAALRIVLALTVLADLAMRAGNLRVHYSDEGLLPRPFLLDHLDPWLVSLAFVNGTPLFQGLLFLVTAAAAVGLLLGYRTRLMTAVVWVLMLSIQWRNPFVGYSADGLLRMLLFWSLFVPLGAVWSLDRQRGRTPPLANGAGAVAGHRRTVAANCLHVLVHGAPQDGPGMARGRHARSPTPSASRSWPRRWGRRCCSSRTCSGR